MSEGTVASRISSAIKYQQDREMFADKLGGVSGDIADCSSRLRDLVTDQLSPRSAYRLLRCALMLDEVGKDVRQELARR